MNISIEQTEKCVSCGQPTEYFFSTPVSERIGFIIGCGQLCPDCYDKIRSKEKDSSIQFVES